MLYIIIRYYYGHISYVNVSKYNICVPFLFKLLLYREPNLVSIISIYLSYDIDLK